MFIELLIHDEYVKKNIFINTDQIESITPAAFNPEEETYIQLRNSNFIVRHNYEEVKQRIYMGSLKW